MHGLNFEDYPRRLEFARWYLHQCETHPEFSSSILFTNKALRGIFNSHNSYAWSEDNTHATFIQSYQEQCGYIWAGNQ